MTIPISFTTFNHSLRKKLLKRFNLLTFAGDDALGWTYLEKSKIEIYMDNILIWWKSHQDLSLPKIINLVVLHEMIHAYGKIKDENIVEEGCKMILT